MRWPWWLVVLGAAVAAVLGKRMIDHQKIDELEKDRRRAEIEALNSKHTSKRHEANVKVMEIDRELEEARRAKADLPVRDRVAANVAEARRRKAAANRLG